MTAPTLATKNIYKGRVVDLRLDTVQLPNGHQTDLEVIRHPGAAAVVPIDAEGNVVLVRQYRHATGGTILEVPAGKLDPGEDPADCARRETAEEVGLQVGELVPMGFIWTTPGFTDERIWLFVARDLQPTAQALEPDEVLQVERMPLADALQLAANGGITDGKSICALLRAPHYL